MKINWGKIESVFADIFKIGTEVAAVAEPIVDVANPGIGAVYNLSVNAAMQAEEAADEAAAKETTDAAKLVAITAAVQALLDCGGTAGRSLFAHHRADQRLRAERS